jgi:hypothetical protein
VHQDEPFRDDGPIGRQVLEGSVNGFRLNTNCLVQYTQTILELLLLRVYSVFGISALGTSNNVPDLRVSDGQCMPPQCHIQGVRASFVVVKVNDELGLFRYASRHCDPRTASSSCPPRSREVNAVRLSGLPKSCRA